MKIKRITIQELIKMSPEEYRMIRKCLRYGAIRLLGIQWEKYWKIYQCLRTNDIVIEYE